MSKSRKLLFTMFRAFAVLCLVFSFYRVDYAQSLPTQVLSPVIGPLRVTTKNIAQKDGKWEFNQHKTDKHHKGGGVAVSDDTYAWDANWYKSNDKNADAGQKVFAVADGDVVKYSGVTFGGICNAVLVAHPNKQNPVWYSGYIHLASIKVKLDQRVTNNTAIGTVGTECATNDHLHFVVYKGSNTKGGLVSFNVSIVERGTQPHITNPTARMTAKSDRGIVYEYSTAVYTISPGQSIRFTFDSSRSSANAGSLNSQTWKINNSSVGVAKSFNFNLGRGTHNISLTVTDTYGGASTASQMIVINEVQIKKK